MYKCMYIPYEYFEKTGQIFMKLSGNFGVSPAGDDTMEIEKNKF